MSISKIKPPGLDAIVMVSFENSQTLDHVLENLYPPSGLKYPPVLKEMDLSMTSVELDELPQVLESVIK